MIMKFKIFYEDNHIIVIEKPFGVLSQKDYTDNDSIIEHIKDYLKNKYNKPGNVYLGSLHRLDKNVSGIMVFAKTSKAASRISKDIRNKKFFKVYISLNENSDFEYNNDWNKVENYITREKNISFCSNRKSDDSKKSLLYYKTIPNKDDYSLNIIYLETGRKHQIRATFSSLNNPILGDTLYKSKYSFENNSILLYAISLCFFHPVTKNLMCFYSRPEFINQYHNNISDKYLINEISSFMQKSKKIEYNLSILDN